MKLRLRADLHAIRSLKQLAVSPLLNNCTLLKHKYAVAARYSAEPVSDTDGGTALTDF